MLDAITIITLVGSGIAAAMGIAAVRLSKINRMKRLEQSAKEAKKITLTVGGRAYTVKATPEEIEKLIAH